MPRDNYGRVGDFVRNTEPAKISGVPVRDGRDFVQDARPHADAEREPTALERQLGGCPPRTRKG